MPSPRGQGPLNLLDYWQITCQAKWLVIGLVFVSVLITGIVSKLSPKLYEAKASLYPIKENQLTGGGFSFGGGSKEGSRGSGSMVLQALGVGKNEPSLQDVLRELLNSRLVAVAVVEELNLISYYGSNSKISAASALRNQITVKSTLFKALELIVLTEDPKVAADIANAYFVVLDRLYEEYTITSAKRHRVFIEERLAVKAKKLAEAENSLKEFQTEYRLIEVDDQAGAAMSVAAELHGEVVALEVEQAVLKEYVTVDHPRLHQLKVQIRQLRNELDRMEGLQVRTLGKSGTRRVPLSEKVYPDILETPSLFLDLLRLTRQMKVEEAVYGMLIGMLEQAKIMEVKNLPTIQVLDVAIPPKYPSKPMTLQNMLVALVLSLVFGILFALFLDYVERLKTQKAASLQLTEGAGELSAIDSSGNGSKTEPYPSIPKHTEHLTG